MITFISMASLRDVGYLCLDNFHVVFQGSQSRYFMLHVSQVAHNRGKIEMVLGVGWKVRQISGDKAGNILHLKVEEDVENVLYVHGFLVCALSPDIPLAGIRGGHV